MKINNYLKLFLVPAAALILGGCVGPVTNISTMQGLGKLMMPRFIAHGANPVESNPSPPPTIGQNPG